MLPAGPLRAITLEVSGEASGGSHGGRLDTIRLRIPLSLRQLRASSSIPTQFWHSLITHPIYHHLEGPNFGAVLTTVGLLEFFAHIVPVGDPREEELWSQFIAHVRIASAIAAADSAGGISSEEAAQWLQNALGDWARSVVPGVLRASMEALGGLPDDGDDSEQMPELETVPTNDE
ncbi:hypothetical protein L226DRAFT_570510 [Lentinus tigrinus ALCF2SS1-7]|uniref:uncharacterized protein n=1 Tax=Lentinus tigrinus ALCF2SS1-7 TaxID=1328758 RepID=UPI00116606DF|nr:hypothetical protein L226DRAFT_570510 [Lentinus tigrinus ALCF2SS1-7]